MKWVMIFDALMVAALIIDVIIGSASVGEAIIVLMLIKIWYAIMAKR